MKVAGTKKQLSQQLSPMDRAALLKALQARFEKIMNRHTIGQVCKPDWKLIPKNFGRFMKWKEPAANRMLLTMITNWATTQIVMSQQRNRPAAQ